MEQETASQAMDAVFMELGWYGRYQLLQLLQLLLCIFPLAFNILSVVFLSKANKHWCRKLDNVTAEVQWDDALNVTYGECSVTFTNSSRTTLTVPCPNGLEYDKPVDHSMVSQWGLVCESEDLSNVSQTLLMIGMCVGAFLFTSLADKYGRKPFHVGCHVGLLVVSVAQAFVPSFVGFLPLRFFLGAFQQGTGLCSGILCLEILPTPRRSVQSIAGSILWASAMVVLAALGYLMRDLPWRYLQLAIAAFSLYSVLQIWFTDESLRWLVANGRVKEAERILKKAAALNRADETEVLHVLRSKALRHVQPNRAAPTELKAVDQHGQAEQLLDSTSDVVVRYSVLDFFRHRHVFLCTVINGFAWITDAMVYYGLSLTSTSLADNMYVGFLLASAVELPGVAAFYLTIDRWGRKKSCIVYHLIAGVSLLLSVVLSTAAAGAPGVHEAVVALTLLGKFAISVAFGIVFLYTPELYPTNLRNASLGIASTLGRVGGMVAPYFSTLIKHYPWAPRIVFGLCCLAVPLSLRLLPETSGRELPQTIEEMTEWLKAVNSKNRSDVGSHKLAHNSHSPGDRMPINKEERAAV